jgi:hypothetical protein
MTSRLPDFPTLRLYDLHSLIPTLPHSHILTFSHSHILTFPHSHIPTFSLLPHRLLNVSDQIQGIGVVGSILFGEFHRGLCLFKG